MMADGSIVRCSRTENAELFGLTMGGYGLFGIILDLDVDMVDNMLLRPHRERMSAEDFAARFVTAVNDPTVSMAYGRLNVARRDFFSEAALVSYRAEPTPTTGLPPVTRSGSHPFLSREIYRAQIGSEHAKKARWMAETAIGPKTSLGISTRNSLMNEPVSNLEGRDKRRTDILHEYFVTPQRFNEFMTGCRRIIPKAKAEFLNVTLRFVVKDDTSILSFAPTDRIAAVMSFSQEMTPEGEADMILTTEALIDLVQSLQGSFYLPYRLHARRDHIETIYSKASHFAERKMHYDPGLLFRNLMWDSYFAA